MATQTTGGQPQGAVQVEVSVNGSAWTDISGEGASISFGGGEQMVGEQHVFCGQYPIVTPGLKMAATTAEVNIVYTETASEAFDILWTAFEDGGTGVIYIRYSPLGGQSTEYRYFASDDAGSAATAVPIQNLTPPDADASSAGDLLMCTFSVMAPQWKQETIA